MKMLMQLKEFSYLVKLGCTEAERSFPQEVKISVEIEYPEAPEICYNDKIEGGLCYAKLSERLATLLESQSFSTIEHIAYKALQEVLASCSQGLEVSLRAHKVKPPIMRFTQGVVIQLRGKT